MSSIKIMAQRFRVLLLAVIGVFGLACLPACGPGPDYGRSFERSLEIRAVTATVRMQDGNRASGTGTVIGVNGGAWILTAAHVVELGGPFTVEFFGTSGGASQRFSSGVEVVVSVPNADLALLRLRTQAAFPEPMPVCPPGCVPTGNFPVFSYGCSGGNRPTFIACRTSGRTNVDGLSGSCWRTTGETARGRSGCALVDARGFVMGVLKRMDNDETGLFQGLDEIHRMLERAGRRDLYAGGGR